jgi:hypothetical protein
MCFCKKGMLLACVGADRANTVAIYDWRKGCVVTQSEGEIEDGRRILSIRCDLLGDGELVTCGVFHVKFWYGSQRSQILAVSCAANTHGCEEQTPEFPQPHPMCHICVRHSHT